VRLAIDDHEAWKFPFALMRREEAEIPSG
jgi:hypothetical protein